MKGSGISKLYSYVEIQIVTNGGCGTIAADDGFR